MLYAYLMRHPDMLWKAPTRGRSRIGALLALAPIAVYVAAMLVASTAPRLSLGVYLLVPLLYFLLVTALRRRPSTRSEADDFA